MIPQLTDEQKKILDVFSRYARSYGKNKVRYSVEYYDDGKPEMWSKSFFDADGGSSLPGYDKILDLIRDFANDLSNDVVDYMEDDGYASLDIIIDCKEKDITFEVHIQITNTSSEYHENEIDGEPQLESIVSYMKEHNYKTGTIDFSGGGDSGYIEDSIYFEGGRNQVSNFGNFGNLEDFLYDMLQSVLPGWEIDEGSQGNFTIDLDNNVVGLSIEINSREMENVGTIARFEF